MRRQPHAYIGDQRDGDTGGLRLLLEQVDTLGAIKDPEMGSLADGRDQPLEDGPGDVLERLVTRFGFKGVSATLRREGLSATIDEAAFDQHLEQVIRRRSRHADISDQRRALHRPRPGREVEQDIKGPPDCW